MGEHAMQMALLKVTGPDGRRLTFADAERSDPDKVQPRNLCLSAADVTSDVASVA